MSSSSHSEKISIGNTFIISNLNVRYKIDINKTRSNFPNFKDIKLPKLKSTDVTILISADSLKLHIDFRYISDEDPCAVKTELGWILLEGKKSSVHVQSDRISNVVETLDFETFCNINSYGTIKKPDRIFMTRDEKKAYDILEKSICFKNSHYDVGLKWKDSNMHLIHFKK